MTNLISRISLTIRSGEAVSTEAPLDGHIPTILQMSADWTAADITFAGSVDNTNFYFIYATDGTILTIPTNTGHRINLPSTLLTNHKQIKVCSGTAVTPVNQAADRTLYLELWE